MLPSWEVAMHRFLVLGLKLLTYSIGSTLGCIVAMHRFLVLGLKRNS